MPKHLYLFRHGEAAAKESRQKKVERFERFEKSESFSPASMPPTCQLTATERSHRFFSMHLEMAMIRHA
jgi:hypothetical protein